MIHFNNYTALPPIHIYASSLPAPHGMTPERIKNAYNLPADGGSGTIAIVGVHMNKTIEHDLAIFSNAFNLPSCTVQNGCFKEYSLPNTSKVTKGWALETALDVEWAHAIAPRAHILLVDAKTASGSNLIQAVDYARSQPGVVAVSMSWGGQEFPDETSLDNHFTSNSNITFFAASGDNGAGASWPAASPNVVAVGGSTLILSEQGSSIKESAWQGSGGGISKYEQEPSYQSDYNIKQTGNMRAIPDVAYDADPSTGFPIYCSYSSSPSAKVKGWYIVGGTSAGTPQWAAIKALGLSASNEKFYNDKASSIYSHYFRDIISGSNGDCAYYCDARKHYDFVTGLGSPQTAIY